MRPLLRNHPNLPCTTLPALTCPYLHFPDTLTTTPTYTTLIPSLPYPNLH